MNKTTEFPENSGCFRSFEFNIKKFLNSFILYVNILQLCVLCGKIYKKLHININILRHYVSVVKI